MNLTDPITVSPSTRQGKVMIQRRVPLVKQCHLASLKYYITDCVKDALVWFARLDQIEFAEAQDIILDLQEKTKEIDSMFLELGWEGQRIQDYVHVNQMVFKHYIGVLSKI